MSISGRQRGTESEDRVAKALTESESEKEREAQLNRDKLLFAVLLSL